MSCHVDPLRPTEHERASHLKRACSEHSNISQ